LTRSWTRDASTMPYFLFSVNSRLKDKMSIDSAYSFFPRILNKFIHTYSNFKKIPLPCQFFSTHKIINNELYIFICPYSQIRIPRNKLDKHQKYRSRFYLL
jgi:hypothetical protein